MFVQELALVVVGVSPKQAAPSPSFNRIYLDAKHGGHLFLGEHPAFTQTVVTDFQTVLPPNVPHDDEVEVAVGARAEPTLVQDLGDLRLGVLIQQTINLRHNQRARLAHLPRRQRERPMQRASGATLEPDMERDVPIPDQGHIFE
jgi:hypothetical protein